MIAVTFSAEIEEKVRAIAARRGIDPSSFVATIVEERLGRYIISEQPNGDGDDDFEPMALERAIAAMTNRTPEQIKAAQERALRESRPKIELPPGVSALDVMQGLKGAEIEEEEDADALSRSIAEMRNRTPEERAAMRERVLAQSPAPLPIPNGKTIFDVIPRIRGRETEQEFYEALERMS